MHIHSLLSVVLLSTSTLACLQIYGSGRVGFTSRMDLTLVDNGVQVCSVSGKGSGTMNCISGYWAWHAWGAITKPVQIEYNPPHGKFKFVLPNNGCEHSNCCPSESHGSRLREVAG